MATNGRSDAARLERLVERVRGGLPLRVNSKAVEPGDAFVAVPGSRVHGRDFIPHALEQGASWVVAGLEDPIPEAAGVTVVRVADPKAVLGELAKAAYGTENLPFPVVGVTGTNGKTTIVHTLERLYKANDKRPGVIGTVAQRWPGFEREADMTTPDCLRLHEYLGAMAKADVDAAFMEVSSHALDQNRVAGLEFSVAVLTNVSQDHLDYHPDMESYFGAKALLFRTLPRQDKLAVINADDPNGRRLLLEGRPAVAFGLGRDWGPLPSSVRRMRGRIKDADITGFTLAVEGDLGEWELRSSMVGEHNAMNLLAVMAVARGLGMEPEAFKALEEFCGAPGRLERIPVEGDRHIFVDYAHTPDALDNVLRALKPFTRGRLITVFGCGGNRDRTKRPLMGKAVAAYSDIAVLTSDNPRHEEPVAIMDDVRPGLAGCPMVMETPDRRMAIAAALDEMRPGDVLLIAGKGHEPYQQVGDVKYPFSDQAVVRELLA